MDIGKRLKKARKEAGLTQSALARISGVDQARISGLETGTQEQSVYLVELALALGVDAGWLQTGVASTDIKVDHTAVEKEILNLIMQLSDDDRAREIAYIQKLIDKS